MYSIRRFPLSFSSCTIDVAHTPDTLINNQNFIHMTKHLRYLFAALLVWICTVGGYAQTTVTDEITWSGLGLNKTNSNYSNFSSKKFVSTAEYSGNASSGSGKYIQLRTSKSSGIVTTASGGNLKEIKIEFNTSTSNNRAVDIYGSNTAYGGFDNLFNSTSVGTKIGTATKTSTSTSTTIQVTDSYKYIGIRSNDGALYINKITIVWETSSSSLTSTTTSFGDNSKKTFNFVKGVLDGFTAPVATAKAGDTDITSQLHYSSSAPDIVTVASDGTLTFTNTKFGTAEIKAEIVKGDTYDTSSDTYTVVNSEPAKTATSLSFGADEDGSTVALIEGLLSDGSDFTGYTATESTGAAGTISYAATGDKVATVDPATGALTINKTTYGTTTITATFAPTDAETYATSTAMYKITNEKKVDESEIVFDVTKDKSGKASGVSKDELTKGIVTISSTSAVLGGYGDYRLYSKGKTTFSLSDANRVITSIKFEGGTQYSKLTADNGTYTQSTGLWEGKEATVVFTTPASTTIKNITKITVTTAEKKENPTPALSFTNPTQEVELKEEYVAIQTLTKPADLADNAITYVSSDNTIAEVTDGLITLKKTGEVTIKATSVATDIYSAGTAEYTLKVVDNRAEAPISVKEESVDAELYTEIYDIAYNLNNTNGLKLTYASSNEDIKIDAETGYITFTKVGSAIITVSFAGDKSYKPFEGTFTLNITDSRKADENFKFDKTSYEIEINEVNGSFYAANYLSNPNDLKVTWTIEPASSATIDKDGKVSVNERGTYAITATGAAKDNYSETVASCQLIVNDNTIEDKEVTFVAGVNKGTQAEYVKDSEDKMSVNPVTIYSTFAAFAASSTNKDTEVTTYTYRMYTGGLTSVSTKAGKIRKIKFVGSGNTDDSNSLVNLKSDTGDYLFVDANNAVWTGSAKEVVFEASKQVRATKIIVTLELPKAKDYTFSDDASTIALEDYENANVTIDRKLTGNDGWWTLCLPFALDADQVKTYFGEGTKLRTFDSMNGTTMNFKAATEMEAGKPYLVEPTKDFDGTTTPFVCVQLKADDPVASTSTEGYAMVGTYCATNLATDGTDLFLGANNKFYKPSEGGNTIKGFRVYFQCPADKVGTPMTANIDGVETAITRIDGEQLGGTTDTRVYNLQGQCVGNTLRGLASGIYVCGGRKVVVK